jgi:phosphomannomutase
VIQLSHNPGVVVTNLSTTQAIDDLATRYGGSVIRTPIGQAYVAEAVKETRAVVGGEGSGGVILPDIQFSHDSLAAIGRVLEFLAVRQNTISDLAAAVPRFYMVKRNLGFSPRTIYSVIQDLRASIESEAQTATLDLSDGIKLSWPDGWVHVRDSNTESMIRIIAESKEPSRAESLADWAQTRVRMASVRMAEQ